jgi:putative copper export protein/methionine-rich copper-binding protein CopC
LRSAPAANSVLQKPPGSVRLVFSEAVVPELSQIILVRMSAERAAIDSSLLKVSNDPHDVHTLVGRVSGLQSGSYKVVWRVLSADGHPVSGSYSFTVAGNPTAVARTASRTAQAAGEAELHDSTKALSSTPSTTDTKPVPVMASILRGIGLGAMMAGLGLLFFATTAGDRRRLGPRVVIVRLIAIGAILLVAHMIAWLQNISATGGLSGVFISSVFGSTVGRIELTRVVLALLTLWAIALARRETLALALGGACLLVSGAVGHPAAIDPYFSIPAKMAHLISASLWLGGLLWLAWLSRCDDAACRAEAGRVSSVALITVIAIFLTGVLQSVLFLNSPGDLVHTDYGRLVVAKAVGLAILVAYGAYNRLRLLPHLERPDTTNRLSRSVKQELVVVTIVILIGGFLAYVPTPPTPQSSLSAFAGPSQ